MRWLGELGGRGVCACARVCLGAYGNAGLGETAYKVQNQTAHGTDDHVATLHTPHLRVSHTVFSHSSLSVFQEARLQICVLSYAFMGHEPFEKLINIPDALFREIPQGTYTESNLQL